MIFEFDPNKSKSNKEKHSINFFEAQALWGDPDLVEIPVNTIDETRYMVIGRISNIYWSGIITYRGENIRIISVRQSRPEEIKIYES